MDISIKCRQSYKGSTLTLTPTYKQYIDVVIHPYINTYIHTYIHTRTHTDARTQLGKRRWKTPTHCISFKIVGHVIFIIIIVVVIVIIIVLVAAAVVVNNNNNVPQ